MTPVNINVLQIFLYSALNFTEVIDLCLQTLEKTVFQKFIVMVIECTVSNTVTLIWVILILDRSINLFLLIHYPHIF